MQEGERARHGDLMVAVGATMAGLAVAAGAFGAHLLESRLTETALRVYETAVRYQMYHAVALLFAGRFLVRRPSRLIRASCWLFLLGIVLFSGSLYGMALSGMTGLGALTPLGGVAFLLGWACLAVAVLRWGPRPL
jgi:uncharacterized membrane protein YgdD (TMEM256/DUF423 family)